MKHLQLSLLVISIFFISCNDSGKTVSNEIEVANQSVEQIDTNKSTLIYDKFPFEMILSIEHIEKDDYYLVIDIDVCEGCYYASPNSNNGFKGLLRVELDAINNVVKEDVFTEAPLSVPSSDPFSNKPVNWVMERTVFRQKLTVINKNDFEIKGSTAFVVEPVCSRYQTDFILINKDGKLTIEKGETRIANLE